MRTMLLASSNCRSDCESFAHSSFARMTSSAVAMKIATAALQLARGRIRVLVIRSRPAAVVK
jgi:hypothetical protein